MTDAWDQTDLDTWAAIQVDMHPHYRTLVRYAQEAESILELGVRGAVSTWAFLTGMSPTAHMWSIEINPLHHMPKPVTDDPRWTLLLGDDMDPEVQAQVPEHVDLGFIDTSHEYEHTVAEIAFVLTRTPARIIFHDYVMEPVRRAVDEFLAREGWHLVANELPFGLATVEP